MKLSEYISAISTTKKRVALIVTIKVLSYCTFFIFVFAFCAALFIKVQTKTPTIIPNFFYSPFSTSPEHGIIYHGPGYKIYSPASAVGEDLFSLGFLAATILVIYIIPFSLLIGIVYRLLDKLVSRFGGVLFDSGKEIYAFILLSFIVTTIFGVNISEMSTDKLNDLSSTSVTLLSFYWIIGVLVLFIKLFKKFEERKGTGSGL